MIMENGDERELPVQDYPILLGEGGAPVHVFTLKTGVLFAATPLGIGMSKHPANPGVKAEIDTVLWLN